MRTGAATWDSMEDVGDAANPADDRDDALALARYASALADGLVASLPGWVERRMLDRVVAFRGVATDAEREDAKATGRRVADEAEPLLRRLLTSDVDEQSTTPLEVVRATLHLPTDALRAMGIPPVRRDEFEARQFPHDDYDLVPRSIADIDAGLQEPALTWGAAKAHVHLKRRRAGERGMG
jgi:hypothetical protein